MAMVVCALSAITLEAEAGGSLSSRPAWSTEQIPGQLGLHSETLSQVGTGRSSLNKF